MSELNLPQPAHSGRGNEAPTAGVGARGGSRPSRYYLPSFARDPTDRATPRLLRTAAAASSGGRGLELPRPHFRLPAAAPGTARPLPAPARLPRPAPGTPSCDVTSGAARVA